MNKPGIKIKKVWSDDDLVELRVDVSDGISTFVNRVYGGHSSVAAVAADLAVFKDQVYGGLLDIRLGEFGPEYANGGFHARFHFAQPGKLCITCRQESEYFEFGNKSIASEARIHLKSEPALLDNFIAELNSMADGKREDAYLETI